MVPANCFIYNSFNSSELEQKAKSTRSNFLGFVRYTFERILAQGSALWEFKSELLVHLGQQEGKAAFEAWLDSEEFGASRYIARSAMQLSAWYNTLPEKVQRLVMRNCHRWSVSALCELQKLTVSLITELVSSRKKHTARSVRDAAAAAAEMTLEEWECIAEHYGLSESELCNVREQARIFAIAETPEDATTALIRRGHVTKALEHLGFRLGQKPGSSEGSSQNSTFSSKRHAPKVAISTYNLSEEDERKLTKLAETRGVTPNKLIGQLLATAPEFQEKEEEPAPSTAEIEQKYREQIAALQEQLAAAIEQMRSLQQQVAASHATPAPEKAAETEPAAPAELVEATAEEIFAIAPTAARSVDVRRALATAGESTVFLVQRLVKSLKKATAERTMTRAWEEDFAIEENQEIDNWEPA